MLARKIWAFGVSDFGEFVDMNQIIINQMKYAIMITILNFSSIMNRVLPCFIVISHIIYFMFLYLKN